MNILHMQVAGNIRTWKQANALRKAGHHNSLFYGKQKPSDVFPELSDEVFSELIQYGTDVLSMNAARYDAINLALHGKYDVVHCHNDVFAHWLRKCDVPIVLDIHDMASLSNKDKSILSIEKSAVTRADSVMVVSEEMGEEVENAYGRSWRIVFNYVAREELEARTCIAKAGRHYKHAVYSGRLNRTHRRYSKLFSNLGEAGIGVTVFSQSEKKEKISGVIFEGRISPFDAVWKCSAFDCGLIPFDYEPLNRHLDTAMPHKLFVYLAAGIPVFAKRHKSFENFFHNHNSLGFGCGQTYDTTEELINLIENSGRLTSWPIWREKTMESQVPILEEAYMEAMGR